MADHQHQPSALRLTQPADLLSAIPYLLGYHPLNCVVAVGLDGDRLFVTATREVPSPRADAHTPSCSHHDSPHLVVEALRDIMIAQGATGVLVAGYGEATLVDPVLTGLYDAYAHAGLRVHEVLRAHNGRYWSMVCDDPRCCPAEGTAYDVRSSMVAAQATVLGRVALPDRATFVQQVEAVDAGQRTGMRVATEQAVGRLRRLTTGADDKSVSELLRRAGRVAIDTGLGSLAAHQPLTDDEVAWLSVLADTRQVRRVAWTDIAGEADAIDARRHLWLNVLRRADEAYVAAAGCLFAFAAWRCGEGTLAKLAVERVLVSRPRYALGRLLEEVLSHGCPPWTLTGHPDLVRGRRSQRRRSGSDGSRRSSNRLGRTRPV